MTSYLDQVAWNEQGLAPAIAVDATSDKLLMQAWVNREALATAVAEKRAVYWSRSRGKLWRKSEESRDVQRLIEIRLDGDAICYRVEQVGGIACHTSRAHCFYQQLENEACVTIYKVLVEPEQLYRT